MADAERRGKRGMSGEDRGYLLSMMSHELRTPLTMVLSASRVLQRHPVVLGDEGLTSLAGDLVQAGRRLERVMENTLLLAHLNEGDRPALEPILVRESVTSAIKDHKRDFPESNVEVAGSPREMTVEGEPSFFRLVLLNLLRNAEEHGKPEAAILVSWEPGDSGGNLYVCNEDRADAPGDYDEWFRPFYRSGATVANPPGAGLGLTVAREMARSMDGDLTAERWSDKSGTRMVLALPLLSVDG